MLESSPAGYQSETDVSLSGGRAPQKHRPVMGRPGEKSWVEAGMKNAGEKEKMKMSLLSMKWRRWERKEGGANLKEVRPREHERRPKLAF